MSYLQNGGFFNNPRKPLPRSNAAVKIIDKLDDHKLKQLARCCICFENYSLNTRAPISAPCGHSFCAVCIRKLIYGNLVCCCICRNVTFFGPKELGKNIQLLDMLEHLGLLDPDEKVAAIQYASSSNFPENVIEAVEDKDLVKFFDFCFTFVKKFYQHKHENLVTNLAMVNGHQEIVQRDDEMLFVRSRLGDSLDQTLTRLNECLQTLDSYSTDRDAQILNYDYGGVDDYIPFMEDNYNDPFGLESATVLSLIPIGPSHEVDFLRAFEEIEREPPSIMEDANVVFVFHPSNEHGNNNFPFNEEREEYEDPTFQPGAWNPVSKLFAQFRSQNNYLNY